METIRRLLLVDRSLSPDVVAGAVYRCEWRVAERGEIWVGRSSAPFTRPDETTAYTASWLMSVPTWVVMNPNSHPVTDVPSATRDVSEPVVVVAETKPRLVLRHNWNEETQ